MLISNLYYASYKATCSQCGDTGHVFIFKLKSVILENEPEIEICEKCLFEKLTGEKQTYNQERWQQSVNKKRWFGGLWQDFAKNT